jgi:hypothetical protein
MSQIVQAAPARLRSPLLYAGVAAGPLYVGIGTLEAVLRDGFDIRVHSLSLLANGPAGWVHSAMMIITGLLTVLGAVGLRTGGASPAPSGVTAAGIVVFGLGLTAAGFLRADPQDNFPLGTPAGPPETITWHGIGHLIAGGIGFLGLIIACLAYARRAQRTGHRGWAVFSLVTGVYYLVSFAGIASGAGNTVINIAFSVAVVLGWTWLTMLYAAALRKGLPL